jgi:hypothetical protein
VFGSERRNVDDEGAKLEIWPAPNHEIPLRITTADQRVKCGPRIIGREDAKNIPCSVMLS